jgi:hypothetical protein
MTEGTTMKQTRARLFKGVPISLIAMMATLLAVTPVLIASARTYEPTSYSAEGAKMWLHAAAAAMGGEEQLLAIKSLKFKGEGHTYLLEQSERPEGPWIVNYEEVSELRDFAGGRFRQEVATRGAAAGPEMTSITAEGMTLSYTTGAQPRPLLSLPADDEWLVLSPERILFTALDATDLHAEPDTLLQGVQHHVVGFSRQGETVRLFLNISTSLPTAIENTRTYPYDVFWGVWGDVRTRKYLSFWTLERGGVHYPRQWDIERNGQAYKSFAITDLVFNPSVAVDSFIVPANVRQAFASRKPLTIDERPLGRLDKPAQELAPEVVLIPGAWNVTLVHQADGVVVVEAPISSGYSAKVISEVERRFPNVPIKAVISTADAWPHIGGAREYVARGVPLYALDLNRPILERLLFAPHRLVPDLLARSPRKPDFRIVTHKTVVGTGANRLELYPVRTETGERMLMVYLPDRQLLYGSDLVQGPLPDGLFFMPQYLSELMDAVRREKLTVSTIFAMHAGPTPWTKITAEVSNASASSK